MLSLLNARARATLLALALSIAGLAAFVSPASAAWGDLDPAFGGDGIVNPGGAPSSPTATVVQPDGKIVHTGGMLVGGVPTLYVSRLLADGSPDPGFGTGGTFVFSSLAAGVESMGWALKLQSDGKVLVSGYGEVGSAESLLLVRLTSGGTLDTAGFGGGNGYVLTAVGSGDGALFDVDLIGSDIVVSGTWHSDASTVRPLVRRYSEAGVAQVTFNNSAAIALSGFSLISEEDYVGVGVTPAGGVLALFNIYDSGTSMHRAKSVRLVSTGGIDGTYGTGGVATLPGEFSVNADVTAADGSVLVAGGRYTGPGYNITAVGRITAAGAPDSGFGTGSVTALDITPTSRSVVMNIRQMPDGRAMMLVLSFLDSPTTSPFTSTAVLSAGGSLLQTFGTNGLHAYPEFGSKSYPYGLALQPDGSAVVVGSGVTGTSELPLVARLKPEFEPAPPKIVPTSSIKSPSKKKLKAKKLKRFSGAAGPAGQIAKVEIALQRVDAKLLKKKKRCLWLSSAKAKFKKVKAVKKKCSAPRWLKSTGTNSWSYKLKKKLPKGSYVLSVRATATDGSVQAKPTTKRFKIT